MFTTYEVADNLLLDMLGRPNYWSNVTREKPGESFGAFGKMVNLDAVLFPC